MKDKGINVLSLFDGMSCGQIALERAGIKVKNYYACEIKPHAISVTLDNYPDTIHLGDVRNISAYNLEKIDLIIGGSPCQDLSKANNKRTGLKGGKSILFFEYVRLLNECRKVNPDIKFLLENVEMTTANMKIISDNLGVFPININSELVSAQNRSRFYWTNIGNYTKDLFGGIVSKIPKPKDKKILLRDIIENGYTEREKSHCLLESESRPLKSLPNIAHRHFNKSFCEIVAKDKETYLRVKEATKIGFVDVGNNQGVDLSFPESKTRRGRLMADISNCLLTNNEYFIFQDGDLRYLSQIEMERLQTVPDGYTKSVNRNKAANLLGDGWTIDVISHILSHANF